MPLPPPGRIAAKAVQDCLLPETLAVRETTPNWSKWIKLMLERVGIGYPAPWCAAFAVTRFEKASEALGLPLHPVLPRGIKGAWTPNFRTAAIKRGLWIPIETARSADIVRPGDIACYYFPSLGRIGHVEVVTGRMQIAPITRQAVEAFTIAYPVVGVYTVGGNTGPDPVLSSGYVSRDGDGVYNRKRHFSSFAAGSGFVRVPDHREETR